MIGSVRTGRPAATAAKENNYIAINLILSEVYVRRLRRAGQASPANGPSDARLVCTQSPGESPLTVNQFGWHFTEARQARAKSRLIIVTTSAHVERIRRSKRYQYGRGQN